MDESRLDHLSTLFKALADPARLRILGRLAERPHAGHELAEELVDVEDWFQQWRFRHMKTVERIIGFKRGTGGSSGVAFLKTALERSFFPELWELRTLL